MTAPALEQPGARRRLRIEIALLRVEQDPTGIEPLIPDPVADSRVSTFTPHKLTPGRPTSGRTGPP